MDVAMIMLEIFLLSILSLRVQSTAPDCAFFVSITGKDLPTTTGTITDPFQSVLRGIESARRAASSKTVCLRSGTYRLNDTISLGVADEGMVLMTYAADVESTGRAVISGGIEITGFTGPDAKGRITAKVPPGAVRPSTLFINNQWMPRARMPKRATGANAFMARYMDSGSTFKWASPLVPCNGSVCPDVDRDGFVFDPKDMISADWHNLDQVQVLAFHSWTAFWSNISAIHTDNNTLLFTSPHLSAIGQYARQGGQRYLIENVLEGLDEPGEWYWDTTSGNLMMIPTDAGVRVGDNVAVAVNGDAGADVNADVNADVSTLVVEVPQLQRLFNIEVTTNIRFVDLELKHASGGDRVNNYAPKQSALYIAKATHVTFERVSVSLCGGTAWVVDADVQRLAIVNSSAHDVGGEGIEMTNENNVTDVVISNCIINNTALIVLGQPAGIHLRGQCNISAKSNTVGFSPYSGIAIGWETGVDAEHGQYPVTPIFIVERNNVHDYGLGILSDFGGIYISSNDNTCFEKSPSTCYLPTLVNANVVERCTRFDYGCQGTYMDEQVSGVIITNNIYHSLQDSGIYFHCGTANNATNNVIAMSAVGTSGCNSGGNPTWPNLPKGFTFSRNIVYLPHSTEAFAQHQDFGNTSFSDNVYFSPDTCTSASTCTYMFPNPKKNGKAPSLTWSQWQKVSGDARSIVADPMFAAAPDANFQLLPGSPALELGIKSLDGSTTGCHNNPFA